MKVIGSCPRSSSSIQKPRCASTCTTGREKGCRDSFTRMWILRARPPRAADVVDVASVAGERLQLLWRRWARSSRNLDSGDLFPNRDF